MQAMLFVMAILGCGEGDAPCQQVEIAPVRYQSEAACLAATEDQLARRDDILFPQIVAQCRPADARPQLIRASEILRPEPEFNRAFPVQQAALRSSR